MNTNHEQESNVSKWVQNLKTATHLPFFNTCLVLLIILIAFSFLLGVYKEVTINVISSFVTFCIAAFFLTAACLFKGYIPPYLNIPMNDWCKEEVFQKWFKFKIDGALKKENLTGYTIYIEKDKDSEDNVLCGVTWPTRFYNKEEEYPGFSKFFLVYIFNSKKYKAEKSDRVSIDLRLGQLTQLIPNKEHYKELKDRKTQEIIGIKDLVLPLKNSIVDKNGFYSFSEDDKELYTCKYTSIAFTIHGETTMKHLLACFDILADMFAMYYKEALTFAPVCKTKSLKKDKY